MDRLKKQRLEESEKRRAEERRSEKSKSEKKEDAGARKGSKVAKHCVFRMVCGSGGLKVYRLAKAAGAEPCGQMRADKLHAIVARRCAKHISKSKCTLLNTPWSDHFWKLRCRKSARPRGRVQWATHTGGLDASLSFDEVWGLGSTKRGPAQCCRLRGFTLGYRPLVQRNRWQL